LCGRKCRNGPRSCATRASSSIELKYPVALAQRPRLHLIRFGAGLEGQAARGRRPRCSLTSGWRSGRGAMTCWPSRIGALSARLTRACRLQARGWPWWSAFGDPLERGLGVVVRVLNSLPASEGSVQCATRHRLDRRA
jgi:hypothetical protein